MMHWGRAGDPIPCYLPGLAPDPSTNHWKLDIETLKVQYGEKLVLIRPHWGSILGPQVSGQVLSGFVIPVPVVIISLLLSLYSILTIYCVVPCMSVMHDVL